MKYILPFLLFTVSGTPLQSQYLSAYIDPQEAFHVFDDGRLRKLEHLPVINYKVGHQYVAYTDNSGRLKVYYRGLIRDLYESQPNAYYVTDHLMVYESNGILKVMVGKHPKTIATQVNKPYALSDSLIAYRNDLGIFSIFWQEREIELEGHWPRQVKVAGNHCSYINHLGELLQFKDGKKNLIESKPPVDFKVSNNVLAYIDAMGQLVVYYDNQYYELTPYAPEYYTTADDMVIYIDGLESCQVFYKGNTTELLPYPPPKLEAEDEIIYFEDLDGYAFVFHKGKITRIANHPLEESSIHRNMIAFTDLDGKLSAFIGGQIVPVSEGIVDNRFRIDGEVIRYIENTNMVHFFVGGKTF